MCGKEATTTRRKDKSMALFKILCKNLREKLFGVYEPNAFFRDDDNDPAASEASKANEGLTLEEILRKEGADELCSGSDPADAKANEEQTLEELLAKPDQKQSKKSSNKK